MCFSKLSLQMPFQAIKITKFSPREFYTHTVLIYWLVALFHVWLALSPTSHPTLTPPIPHSFPPIPHSPLPPHTHSILCVLLRSPFRASIPCSKVSTSSTLSRVMQSWPSSQFTSSFTHKICKENRGRGRGAGEVQGDMECGEHSTQHLVPTQTITTYVCTSGDTYIGSPLSYPPSWWPLVADCLLHTICLDSCQTDFLLTAAKREHCLYWISIRTVCLYTHKCFIKMNVSFIASLTVSSLLRTFFTANSLMTESTSPSNTSASILATSFSDERMVGSRGFSTLRPLTSFWNLKWRHHIQREHHDKTFRSQSKPTYVHM